MTASIMMITYNRLELTKQTLEYVKKITYKHNLIIIDNGSNKETKEYLQDLHTYYKPDNLNQFILSINKENLGIAIGRNQALKIAEELNTEWYCTMDNDVGFTGSFLTECIDIIKANPSYGMIGVNLEPKPYPIITVNGKSFQNKSQGNLGTACMVFSKSVHKMIGFFNTTYGKYGLEDSDYGFRARVAGFKLGYIKEMGIHLGVGEHDKGEYREWKSKTHNEYLKKFYNNCNEYLKRRQPIYFHYKET